MFLEIGEKLAERMQEITGVNYLDKGDFMNAEYIITAFEDLIDAYYSLQEEYEDFKQDVEDNYEPVSYERQIGE